MDTSVSRRAFLKLAGLTGAGAGVAASAAGTAVTTAFAEDSDDTIYYPTGLSTNDITDVDTLSELMAAVMDEQIATAEESLVLLKNDNEALPVAAGSNVTLLGVSTVNPYMHRTSNGQGSTYTDWAEGTDYHPDMSYSDGMALAYNVNQTVLDAYTANTATYPGGGVQEGASSDGESVGAANGGTPEDFYTTPVDAEAPASFYEENDLVSSFAEYGDAAFIIFERCGNEDNDLGQTNGVDGISELALQPNERELLALAQEQKAAGTFKKVIVLLNTAHAMEVGDLDSYDVDALVWMGAPGDGGMVGVTNVLTGEVSPSGHLGDTYSTDSTAAPANLNAVENTGIWANDDEILEEVGYTGNESSYSGSRNYDSYVVEAENIYVGYKYFETRYEDCILGQGNATSTAGAYASSGSWDYNAEVTYPFGYGLSYTTFEQTLDSVSYDDETETYTITATVTNTGSTYAGKSVVQVYAQTPYGDYEQENAIEKSAIMLVAFGKTGTIEPGASETIEIELDAYLLASYDAQTSKGFVLTAGDYYLAIGDDAHDALNNVLAAKGATGMTDVLGNAADGDAAKTYTWSQASLDAESFKQSRVNSDYVVTNQFDDCELDAWLGDGTVTYLSRSDWEGTWPVNYSEESFTATAEMIEALKGEYTMPDDAPAYSDFTQGADNGISLIMMRDYDLEDEAWEEFLDQFTEDELTYLLNGGTEAVDSVGIPAETQIDDNTTIGSSFAAVDGARPLSWPHEMNTAATFNHERFEARGRLMGLEAEFCNCSEVWYGGGNLHRTQFCGRNQQYYSEDGNHGYYVGAGEAAGMQGVGVIYCQKHFAGNNQENARESVSTFFREQGFRETELRHFEGAVAVGGAMGEMGGFNRLGLTYCNYSSALNTNVLRNEWGFKGHVTTDAVAGSIYKRVWGTSLSAGTDYYCFNAMVAAMGGGADAVEGVTTLLDEGDGYILECLRLAVKRSCYAWAHTWTMNGLSSSTKIEKITPWWEYALDAAIGVAGVGTVAALGAYVIPPLVGGKKEGSDSDE